MPITFDTSDYEGIRKLISLTLTADVLADTVLGLDVYEGSAIRYVATRTGNTDANAKRAAVLYATTLVLPSVPQLTSESEAGYQYQLKPVDIVARTAQLLQAMEEAIAASELAHPTQVAADFDATTSVLGFDAAQGPPDYPLRPLISTVEGW